MAVKLICASHSPLMEFASPQEQRKEQIVRETFAQLAAEVKGYDPTLIITFSPSCILFMFLSYRNLVAHSAGFCSS